MRNYYRATIVISMLICMTIGCTKFDDNFSTDPTHRLRFSADTLSFDTLFAEVPTTTRRIMIYNDHRQPMMIDQVKLKNAAQSGFRINLDGVAGTEFRHIALAAEDSMYLFVEMTAPTSGSPQPIWSVDSICFDRAGTTQHVILAGAGQDATILRRHTLAKDATFTPTLPYLIFDTLTVPRGTTLTLEPGTSLYFHIGAHLHIEGTLRAEGTFDAPITLRGDRLDNLLTDMPYDLVPGQWSGISIDSLSYDNHLTNTTIRNATDGIIAHRSTTDRPKLYMKDCTVTNMKGTLLCATSCDITIENCELSNALAPIVAIQGGNLTIRHATIANDYAWELRQYPALRLSNKSYDKAGEKTIHPHTTIRIDNSIIYGSMGTEVALDFAKEQPHDYRFNHCLIKANGTDDANFIMTQWNKKPHFLTIDNDKRTYNYRLDSLSAARHVADPEVAKLLPHDRDDHLRLIPEGPDIGAYQHQPTEE